eukprot:4571907-Pleurochrysis_carterae.AAC.3
MHAVTAPRRQKKTKARLLSLRPAQKKNADEMDYMWVRADAWQRRLQAIATLLTHQVVIKHASEHGSVAIDA